MGLQFRRGTDSDRLGVTPDIGEPLFTTNTKQLFIGDGSTAGGVLVSGTISDSGVVNSIISETVDSAYIQARQADIFRDSSFITDIVDSAYVQARQTPQDFAYGSLTGVPTTVSTFTNDANYLDSTTVTGVIDATYIQSNQTTYDFLDSAEAIALIATQGYLTDALDSAEVIGLIDSAYVQARETAQDFAYSSLTGTPTIPTNNNQLTNGAGYITGYTVTEGDVTSHEAALTITESQISDLGTYLTSSSLTNYRTVTQIESMIDSNVNAVIDAAPGALNTLNELAAALGDDANFSTTITNQIAAKVDSDNVIAIVDSAYIQARQTAQDFAYSSLTGAPNVLDSADVVSLITANDQQRDSGFVTNIIDSDYIAARTSAGTDSSTVSSIIISDVDSAYVQARETAQDFAFSSLTGTPTTISGYGITDAFDGAYSSLTGAPTTVSTFTNDANYLDSTTVTSVIDASYIQSNQTTYDFLDSAEAIALIATQGYLTSAIDSAGVTGIIDSDYVEARRPAEAIFDVVNNGSSAYSFTGDGFASSTDNPTIYLQRGLTYKFNINASSHPFQIRVSNGGSAYSTGVTNNGQNNGELIFNVPMDAPDTLVYQCTVHSGMVGDIVLLSDTSFLDSAGIISLTEAQGYLTSAIDSTGVINLIATQGYLTSAIDSANVINLIDSAYVQARQTSVGSGGTDSATVISLTRATIDSDYVLARIPDATLQGVHQFEFIGDSGQTVFTGNDRDGNGLNYNSTDVLVFLNGTLMVPGNDFVTTSSSTITFTEGVDSGDFVTIFNFTAGSSGGLDSAEAISLFDSAYVQARQTSVGSGGLDSAAAIILIQATVDSAYVAAREADAGGSGGGLDSAGVLGLIDSDYVLARTRSGPAVSMFEYLLDSGETVVSGFDRDSNSLSYDVGDIQVFRNGILLVDSNDYAANNGTSITLSTVAETGDIISVAAFSTISSNYTEATTSITAVANKKYIVDCSGGVVTITLPASPSFGQEVSVIDGTGNAETNNIIINRNSNKILGADSDFTLDVNRAAIDLVYYNAAQGWIVTGNS